MVRALCALAAVAWAAGAAGQAAEGRREIMRGVAEIAAPGLPGAMTVFGKDAFVLAAGKTGGALAPVAAAGRLGRGRIVGFGHSGYLDGGAMRVGQTGLMVTNAVRWAAGGRAGGVTVGLVRAQGLAQTLTGAGFAVVEMSGSGWSRQLASVQVVAGCVSEMAAADRAALLAWVQRGGGLLGAETGWGWLQLNPGRALTENGGCALFREGGIAWSDGMLERTSSNGFGVTDAPSDLCHALHALEALKAQGTGSAALSSADAALAARSVSDAAVALGPSDRSILPALREIERTHRAELDAAWSAGLTSKAPLLRLAALPALLEARRAAPAAVRAHPWAAVFPGAPPANAPRVTRTLSVDTRVPNWHSTGLYAAPGALLQVRIASELVGKGLQVRIGAHTDTLWDHGKWERAPEISRAFPLGAELTPAANAFGGAVYILAPERSALGRVSVTVEGAVEAPLFILGETPAAEWRDRIRSRPGPWAELQGRKVILTTLSSEARKLDDPTEVLEFWDRVVDSCAELAGWPAQRGYPERYVCDRQISAGYMHSGYPIMTWMDVAGMVVDLPKLRKEGSWGHFHEMGHNHQSDDWTFEGTGEVTVNLFSMYCYEKVVGVAFDQGHPAIRDAAGVNARLRKYLEAGAKFGQWQSDPFLALTLYIQVVREFGWPAIKGAIASYRDPAAGARPRSEEEKRDQWMVRLSRATGRNLGPFFSAWGIPTSEAARQSITSLPDWMPKDWPGR